MTANGDYYRPRSLDEALELLARRDTVTRPLAGGTHYRAGVPWPDALIDLSHLDLGGVSRGETSCDIGAMTTLRQIAAADALSVALRRAAAAQAPRNVQQRATIGGAIASRDSGTLLACLLALRAELRIEPGSRRAPLAAYLARDDESGHLIKSVSIPASRNCAFAEIRRSPADPPILVVAAGATGEFGDVIVAAGGADQPIVLLPEASRLLTGAPDADLTVLANGSDEAPWHDDGRGTAEYRQAMIPVLLERAVAELRIGREVTHAS